jgi:class 3 adenylate cyclase
LIAPLEEPPSAAALTRVYEHLRTLRRILHDYVPRQLSETPPCPGDVRYEWQEGTLMFTDLAGFTRLTEAHAAHGKQGAEALLTMLNAYFAGMIEIVSKAGGDLLEFTGDALLIQFAPNPKLNDTLQAVRAGLRMQRAMQRFENIETPNGIYSLKMRIGLHRGRFLTADIGTAARMEHVLLGQAVQIAKRAEGHGVVGRVCLTESARREIEGLFRTEATSSGHALVIDDLSDEQLGEYDLVPPTRRMAANVLWDRSLEGLRSEIEKEMNSIEPLACYLPGSTLGLVVEHTAQRRVPPGFPIATVVFVNLLGMTEQVDACPEGGEAPIVAFFSHMTEQINQAIESHGGVLKKVTYHLTGSDVMILFGTPNSRERDTFHAVQSALEIREIVATANREHAAAGGPAVPCQIGVARGAVFAAEVGEPHGRREFNTLGDAVNTAARLMNLAQPGQILTTAAIQEEIACEFGCQSLGRIALKGKSLPTEIFALKAIGIDE